MKTRQNSQTNKNRIKKIKINLGRKGTEATGDEGQARRGDWRHLGICYGLIHGVITGLYAQNFNKILVQIEPVRNLLSKWSSTLIHFLRRLVLIQKFKYNVEIQLAQTIKENRDTRKAEKAARKEEEKQERDAFLDSVSC